VIPALNAAGVLPAALDALAEGELGETIVVDGVRVITAGRGRGNQIAAGVAAASGVWLLLLHADTRLGAGWVEAVAAHIASEPTRAGYFRFALASEAPAARRLERVVAWRCRWLALPYGDQGLLLHRDLLASVGGVRLLPLMEDVDLVRRLGRRRLVAFDVAALTAADRFEREGWHWRSLRNLACLGLYFAGVPPRLIARLYG
jgi:hypothetical protein